MSFPMRQLVKILDDDSGSQRGPGQRNGDWAQVAGVFLSSSKSAVLSHEGREKALNAPCTAEEGMPRV